MIVEQGQGTVEITPAKASCNNCYYWGSLDSAYTPPLAVNNGQLLGQCKIDRRARKYSEICKFHEYK